MLSARLYIQAGEGIRRSILDDHDTFDAAGVDERHGHVGEVGSFGIRSCRGVARFETGAADDQGSVKANHAREQRLTGGGGSCLTGGGENRESLCFGFIKIEADEGCLQGAGEGIDRKLRRHGLVELGLQLLA